MNKKNKGTKDKHRLYSSNNFIFQYECDYEGCDFALGVFSSLGIALLSPNSVATSSTGGGRRCSSPFLPSLYCIDKK